MADINLEMLIAQKKAETEKARKKAKSISDAIDDRGQVKIWLIAEKRWKKVWPVDAMDILKSGSANLDGPPPEREPEPEPESESEPESEPETTVPTPVESPKAGRLGRKPRQTEQQE